MTESIPTTWHGDDAYVQKVLEDLFAAESWEAMAIRCETRSLHRERELVPVPVRARR